jgi:Uma2 family endonuclease
VGHGVAADPRSDVGPPTGRFRRVPPVLAVEVAGVDDTVGFLTEKSRWYLDHGVEVVWLLIPASRSIRVLTPSGVVEVVSDRVPGHPSLPGLEAPVEDLFRQLGQATP